jgi:bacterioferritin-associated ferredoxin
MSDLKDTIVCFCEDITQAQIIEAIEQGFTQPADIKNHLRTGMGPCQGRGCSAQIRRLVRQVTGQSPESIVPLTTRPPIVPVPIGVLAKIEKQKEFKR